MNLHAAPLEALVDEKLSISVTGVTPGDKVTLTAAMCLPWETSEKYEGYAVFIADENGRVDLSVQKPVDGTYDWIDSMGLIASMRKVSSEGASLVSNLTIENHMIIEITAESNGVTDRRSVERIFINPEIKRQKIREPFIGELFDTGDSSRRTILMLGGSDGGVDHLALIAGPFASHGFNVLTVGYFGMEGLPEYLQEIPLEYFETVFAWIKENPLLSNEICIHGTSKGGELALLLASRYGGFTKVAANLPHAYCFQGLRGMSAAEHCSSWSYRGESLPYIKLDNDVFFEELKICLEQDKPFGIACCYQKGLEAADNKEEARIKVEAADADILLFAGKEDGIWNSYDGCREVIEALDRHQYQHQYQLSARDDMGHISIAVPYILPLSETMGIPMMGGVFSVGGTLEGNARGQDAAWMKTLEFFKH